MNEDMIGREFGRWTVIGGSDKPLMVLCQCSCSAKTIREVNKKNLKAGMSRSCSCWDQDRKTSHGMTGTQTYMAWGCMKQRVKNDRRYIENGIVMCERWEKFENFLEDMGVCPEDKYSVDRIDNSKGYEPGNCRWANRSEQQRNKTTNRMVTYDGRTMPASAWAEELGMGLSTLTSRLDNGWTVERTLTTPEGFRRGRGTPQTRDRILEYKGREQTLEEWAKEFELNLSTMIERVWNKWSMERIAATPQGRRGGHKKYEKRKKEAEEVVRREQQG